MDFVSHALNAAEGLFIVGLLYVLYLVARHGWAWFVGKFTADVKKLEAAVQAELAKSPVLVAFEGRISALEAVAKQTASAGTGGLAAVRAALTAAPSTVQPAPAPPAAPHG